MEVFEDGGEEKEEVEEQVREKERGGETVCWWLEGRGASI